MSTEDILLEFKNQLINFFDELINQFPSEGDLVVIRLFLSNQIPIKDVMNNFNYQLNKENKVFKMMIKNRDEQFFLDNNLFDFNSSSSRDKIGHFKRLWRSGVLDDEDKKVMWKWVDSFVYLTDKYTKSIARGVECKKE
jgi:hypothetical protein